MSTHVRTESLEGDRLREWLELAHLRLVAATYRGTSRPEDAKPLRAAEAMADRLPRCSVVAEDLPYDEARGKKSVRFLATGLSDVWRRIEVSPAARTHFYEVLRPGEPCHLHLDVEMEREMNPRVPADGPGAADALLLRECAQLLRSLGLGDPIDVATSDSSTATKFSRHHVLVLDRRCPRDNLSCGALARRLRNACVRNHGPPASNPLFVWARRKEPGADAERRQLVFLADLGVYTRNRHWRCLLCSKSTSPGRVLLPADARGGRVDLDEFLRHSVANCLSCAPGGWVRGAAPPDARIELVTVLEEDGTEPVSTSLLGWQAASVAAAVEPHARDLGGVRLAHYSRPGCLDAAWRWLSEAVDASRREFAFEPGPEHRWRFRRHLRFASAEELRAAVLRDLPAAVHVGPEEGTELRRELTFDIDLTDYHELRPCCGKKRRCCAECWPLAEIGAAIVARLLREELGCARVLCVFSGGRGAHIWALDRRYADAGADFRRALCARWRPPGEWHAGHRALFDEEVRPRLARATARVRALLGPGDVDVLRAVWPRLDEAVTAQPGHLVKMPGTLHPRTAAACCPLRSPDDPGGELRCPIPGDGEDWYERTAHLADEIR